MSLRTVCPTCGTPREKETRCPCQGPRLRDHALDDHRPGIPLTDTPRAIGSAPQGRPGR